MPLLSIVIPTWNRAESTITLIESIGHKNEQEIEIIITDDNSRPEIIRKLGNYCSDYSNIFLYRNHKNLGMVKNWNECIRKAKGMWICFMCDDDIFHPSGVDRIIKLIKSINKASLIIQSPSILDEKEYFKPGIETVNKLNLPFVSGNLWHREITDQIGSFNENLIYSPDAEFWYRIASNFPVIKIREPFAKYIAHENNYAYTTWEKDDFLDQISLICEINASYFYENRKINPDFILKYTESEKLKTIFTILETTCLDRKKKNIFNKYYQLGLKINRQNNNLFQYKIVITKLVYRKIISQVKAYIKIRLNYRKSYY